MIFLKNNKLNYKKVSDEELLAYIQRKNNKALEELYNRYAKQIELYFCRMLNFDKDKAKDFLHDLFLKIISNPDSFDTSKKFSTWIYSIAYNMCKNEYRRNKHEAIELNKLEHTEKEHVTDNIDLKIIMKAVYRELDKMGTGRKTAFLLKYQDGLKTKEIAEILDCPEGTIKSRIFYVLKELSRKLIVFTDNV